MKIKHCALTFALLLFSTPTIAQEITGDWYLNANGSRLTLSIARQGEKPVAYLNYGKVCNERLQNVTWDGHLLEFRRPQAGQWYRVTVDDGVMVGRFAGGASKPPLAEYRYHVTGWNQDAFPVTPAVFDIVVNSRSRGRLRIDRVGDHFIGRLKFYALDNAVWEYPEEDVSVSHWDGETLEFKRGMQVYSGTVEGRTITGTLSCGHVSLPWRGERAEILTYGIVGKTAEERDAWQARTRRILSRLMMAGNPTPLSVNVEILREGLPPIASEPWPARDDAPAPPQNYTLTEIRLTYTLPNWLGGEPIRRVVHAYLSKPNTPPPGNLERYPLVVAVNGHSGSAYQTFNPGGHCWYGDAFARRGYMVLAVDIGHRPQADLVEIGSTADLSTYFGYPGIPAPDDQANGNGFHPAIKSDETTDWEEDGERVWDVMRAIDYALSRSDVDSGRIAVTGLSMGGELASYVGALDSRVAVSIPAGFSPDLNVLKYVGNHRCWNWAWADVREYTDQSDLYALTVPRALIVQTGKLDAGFSSFPQWASLPGVPIGSAPFAGDKQVMRRARVAYAGGPILHFLHSRAHEWQAGELRYATVVEPTAPGDLLWQVNTDTAGDERTVFDYVRAFLGF